MLQKLGIWYFFFSSSVHLTACISLNSFENTHGNYFFNSLTIRPLYWLITFVWQNEFSLGTFFVINNIININHQSTYLIYSNQSKERAFSLRLTNSWTAQTLTQGDWWYLTAHRATEEIQSNIKKLFFWHYFLEKIFCKYYSKISVMNVVQ